MCSTFRSAQVSSPYILFSKRSILLLPSLNLSPIYKRSLLLVECCYWSKTKKQHHFFPPCSKFVIFTTCVIVNKGCGTPHCCAPFPRMEQHTNSQIPRKTTGICAARSVTPEEVLPLSISVFTCQYHSTNVLHSFIHQLETLDGLRNCHD